MFLENVVFDAADPRALGRDWEARLGTETLTDGADGYETRLTVAGGPVLDLCFQPVAEPHGPERLHLDVHGGVLEALRLESADPARDTSYWAWLRGWAPEEACRLRHRSGRGPLLELVPETAPKPAGKNRTHLDVRLEPGDDAGEIIAGIIERGGRELHTDWGDLPWRCFLDPSGNEFCVLPAPR